MKALEQNDNILNAIILSIILHSFLVAMLIINPIQQHQNNDVVNSQTTIDAVIIDPSTVVQQYYQQQQVRAQILRQKHNKQGQQKAKNLHKQHDNQLKKATLQTKKEKKKEITQPKQKISTTEIAKKFSKLDNLLNDLTDAKNAPGLSSEYKSDMVPTDKMERNKVSNDEINAYKAMINRAISDKFYDSSIYTGQTCDLHIKLAQDSMLISVTAIEGDQALCQAAVSASKLAVIPKPSNKQVYEIFKNLTIRFSPK